MNCTCVIHGLKRLSIYKHFINLEYACQFRKQSMPWCRSVNIVGIFVQWTLCIGVFCKVVSKALTCTCHYLFYLLLAWSWLSHTWKRHCFVSCVKCYACKWVAKDAEYQKYSGLQISLILISYWLSKIMWMF